MNKVFFNEDWMHFWSSRYAHNIKVDKTVLKDFIYQYKDTTITDFCLNINGSTSSVPTKFMDTWGNKFLKKQENGVAVDYSNTFAALWYDVYEKQGLDAYKIWIDCLYEIGINPWFSIRMNDCHHTLSDVDLLKSEEVDGHPDWWISRHRNGRGYYCKCFDYSVKEVRDRILGYINEQLEKYDVYGLELDFTREAYCFPYGKPNREIMLSFMREVKNITNRIGKIRNKEIKVSILCQPEPMNAYHNGFDIVKMADEKLVDVVIASPRWKSTNTDIPIEIWKRILPKDVEFGCMHQLLVSTYEEGVQHATNVDMAFGQAVANTARGSDIIYLYNHFDMAVEGEQAWELFDTSIRRLENSTEILKGIGCESLRNNHKRRHPLTFDDFVNLYEKMQSLMPLHIARCKHFRIPTGKIDKGRKVYFVMGTDEPIDASKLNVYLNTVKAKYIEEHKEDKNILEKYAYSFEAQIESDTQTYVEVITPSDIVVTYAEILVE